jgi:uncharacterized protein YciI
MILAMDKQDCLELRAKTRPKHLDWLDRSGRVVQFGGPILADDGETPVGSLIIAHFDDLDDARTVQRTDPYVTAGLFESVVIKPLRQVIPPIEPMPASGSDHRP